MPSARDITQYPILSDFEAPQAPPGPYCVYEITERTVLHRSTGTIAHSEHQVESALISFRIHTQGNTKQSAKAIAAALAEKLMLAFDDAQLDLYPCKQITWSREPDFGVWEDENEYMWVVPYRIVFDKLIARTVRRKIELS